MQKNWKRLFLKLAAAVLLLICVAAPVFAATSLITGTDNTITAIDKDDNRFTLTCKPVRTITKIDTTSNDTSTNSGGISTEWDESTNTLTLKATNSVLDKSTFLIWTTYYYAQNYTNTVTLTNPSDSGVVLKISYTASEDLDIGEGVVTNKDLAPGDSLTFAVRSKETDSKTGTATTWKGTVQITSISKVENSEFTFASSTRGSYTYQIESQTPVTVAKGTAAGEPVSAPPGSEVTLTHGTPDTDYSFYGWMGGDKLLGTADGTYTVQEDMTIYPVYLKTMEMNHTDGAPFTVNGQPYMIWQPAMNASLSTGKPVVINRDYTLPTTLEDAGLCAAYPKASHVSGTDGNINYVVPFGATLLIPYSVDHYSNADLQAAAFGDPLVSTTGETVAAYRTLTLASGTTIDCSGKISVDAWQYSSSVNNTGRVAGPYGKIALAEGSAINLKTGAVLYCYGYITGAGTVTANSGSEVHELFQIMDWRGGNVSSDTYKTMKGDSFLVSQFYIQNIESNLIVNYNANVIAHVTVAAGLGNFKTPYASSMALIGKEGLFVLESGASVSRRYDTTDGRIKYEVAGKAKIDSISLTVRYLTDFTMYSSDYVLNIPSSMSITIKSGATVEIPNRIKLLPDAMLTIEEGATLNLTSGTDSGGNTVNAELILYDYDDWTEGEDEYSWGFDFNAVDHSPSGKRMTKLSGGSAQLIVNGNLNIANGAAVYSTNDIDPDEGNSCLSGTGKITWGTAPSSVRTGIKELFSDTNGLLEVEVDGEKTSYPQVAVALLQAPLAGISSVTNDYTQSMSYAANTTHTYQKYGDYWYINSSHKDPTCVEAGYDRYWCTDDTKYVEDVTAALGHKWLNGECEREGCDDRFKIISINIAVREGLDMYFYVEPSDVAGSANFTAEVVKKFADGREDVTETYTRDQWQLIDGEYRLCFTDISAKEMNDDIHVIIYNEDGTQASYECVQNVRSYAMALLALDSVAEAESGSNNAKLRTALVDMLNYGEACQDQFSYGLDNKATAELTEEQKGYASSAGTYTNEAFSEGENLYAVSFSAKNTLMYTFYYDFGADSEGNTAIDLENTTATIAFTDHHGNSRNIQTKDWFAKQYGSKVLHGIDVTGIPIASGRSTITCTLTGGVESTTTDSIEAFTARTAAGTQTQTTMNMLMRFVDSARAYFSE